MSSVGVEGANLNMRMPKPLLDAIKVRATASGVRYTRFIRQLIEREVVQHGKKRQ